MWAVLAVVATLVPIDCIKNVHMYPTLEKEEIRIEGSCYQEMKRRKCVFFGTKQEAEECAEEFNGKVFFIEADDRPEVESED